MRNTDDIALVISHAVLLILVVCAVGGLLSAKWRKRKGAATATVLRGERSMGFLYWSYGVTTVAISLAVDVSSAAIGHKSTMIVIDYILLTYLFVFSSWFRNKVIFKIQNGMTKD